MQLEIRDSFPVTPATYWSQILFSRPFLERMYKEALRCESVEFLSQSGDLERGLDRALRFTQKVDAPGPVRKVFGETTTMHEEGRFDAAAQRWRFAMHPDRMSDRVKISGETWLESSGTGCDRVCRLDFSVKMFGIGGLVESFISKSTRTSYQQQTQFVLAYIREHALR